MVAVVALGLAALGWLAYDAASQVRADLLRGKEAMEAGRERLLDGEIALARESFETARRHFEDARERARHPLLRLGGWVPVLRRTPNTVTAIAESSEEVASAGIEVAEAAEALPGGLDALAPRDGALPVHSFERLTPAVREASELVGSAYDRVRETPGSLLLGPVGAARREALDQLESLNHAFSTARGVLDGLPGFLGVDGPRRYFLGAQNPAELRGTGGLVGAYSIMTIEDGAFDFGRFLPTQELPNFDVDDVQAPSEDYARNYNQFGGAGFWLNINMTPDFPSAAQAILGSYEKATGVPLDGVIFADPFALEALLELTGPVRIPDLDVEVDAANVTRFLTNESYRLFPSSAVRKVVLGTVAERVFGRFMRQESTDVTSLRTLADVAGDGHLLVYTTDPGMEGALAGANVGGALSAPPGDVLSVIQNNSGANKVDFFLQRSVEYEVRLGSDGSAEARARISLSNDAPTSGQPKYVIGPFRDVSAAGESVSLVNVYCPGSCRLREARLNGSRVAVIPGREGDYRFFQDFLEIPSGGTSTLEYVLESQDVWEGNEGGGTYRLTFLSQGTVRPSRLRVEVVVPAGASVVEASPEMRVEDDRAVWEGTPGYRQELIVRFQRPWYERAWRSVYRFLTRPVVRL